MQTPPQEINAFCFRSEKYLSCRNYKICFRQWRHFNSTRFKLIATITIMCLWLTEMKIRSTWTQNVVSISSSQAWAILSKMQSRMKRRRRMSKENLVRMYRRLLSCTKSYGHKMWEGCSDICGEMAGERDEHSSKLKKPRVSLPHLRFAYKMFKSVTVLLVVLILRSILMTYKFTLKYP